MKIILDTEDEQDYDLLRQITRLPAWRPYALNRFGADAIPDLFLPETEVQEVPENHTGEHSYSDLLGQLAAEIRSQEERLAKQDRAISRLARSPHLTHSNLKRAFDEITEIISQTLNVQRVGIWLMNHDLTGNYCINQYDSSEGTHTDGMTFDAKDYPRYFEAIQTREAIIANDVYTHHSTQEYTETYLRVFGITSMMDIPIWRQGQMIGIICHEHIGPARTWQQDEQIFAIAVADLISLTFESKDRLDLIERLQNTEEELTATNHHLEQALEEVTQALEDLSNAQAKLVEKEKLAVLGQLIAGMAHEFNTPVGAIKSSTRIMIRNIPELITLLPEILVKIQGADRDTFNKMIDQMLNATELLSSADEKRYKKALNALLITHHFEPTEAEPLAGKLVRIGILSDVEDYLPILRHPDSVQLMDALYLLGQFIKNITTIERSIAKTYKVVQALKGHSPATTTEQDSEDHS